MSVGYRANVSDRIPNEEFPFRTFYYCPGVGFDTGREVYYGRNEWRTKKEAEQAAKKWEDRNG